MSKLLIDTNIVLDLLAKRELFQTKKHKIQRFVPKVAGVGQISNLLIPDLLQVLTFSMVA